VQRLGNAVKYSPKVSKNKDFVQGLAGALRCSDAVCKRGCAHMRDVFYAAVMKAR
jgi:hypothetical protein